MLSPVRSSLRIMRILVVGNPHPIHVGAHFFHAACSSDFATSMCDTRLAFDAPWPVVKFNWHLRKHRPPRLYAFGAHVIETCYCFKPDVLLCTGLAPLDSNILKKIGRLGIQRLNFLTDDPWNPAHYAPWFFDALPAYDCVFSPRQANLDELRHAGCHTVNYLPFAYNPDIHFVGSLEPDEPHKTFACEVMFAGGADHDRLPWITALIRHQFHTALYGGYWERYAETRRYTYGLADMETLRRAVAGAHVSLCLVRRANRDGHVMRSFEIPAMGGCMLTEDTPEHREIFGAEGEAVVYFRTIDEMIAKLRWLLDHPDERQRLATAAHRLITGGQHTYRDRLMTMLEHVSTLSSQRRQPA